MSTRNTRLFLLCFLWALTAFSSQASFQKEYYIDPRYSDPMQTGIRTQPFQNLNSAFNQAVSDINSILPTEPFDLIFFCREGTTLPQTQETILHLDGEQRIPSSVRFNTYRDENEPTGDFKPVILSFENPSAHLVFSVPRVKLTLQGFNFLLQIETLPSKPELILIEGANSETTITQCTFTGSKVNLQNPDAVVFNFKEGKYLVKNSEALELQLSNTLFKALESTYQMIKFERNSFNNIITHQAPLIQVKGVTSLGFDGNKISMVSGKLLEASSIGNAILYDNNFSDVDGDLPLKFNSAERVIIGKSSVTFSSVDQGAHKGFLSLTNCNLLGLSDTSLTGYSGTVPAISVVTDNDSLVNPKPVLVMVNGFNADKNSLYVQNTQSQEGLSLLKINLNRKAKIGIENSVFTENTIIDKRDQPQGKYFGASTVWAKARDSYFELSKSTMKQNKASRTLTNLYVDSEETTVVGCSIAENTQLESLDNLPSNPSTTTVFTNLAWFGEEISFEADVFQDNYGDKGGAISISKVEGLKTPDAISITDCVFERNKAQIGGAVYSEVAPVEFNNNRFVDNQASKGQDSYYPEGPVQPKPNEKQLAIFLEVVAQGRKTIYESGEFTLMDVASGQDTGYSLNFYLSTDKAAMNAPQEGQYYSSIFVARSEGAQESQVSFAKGFNNKLTGPSVEVSSFRLIAPPGSLHTILVTMKNRDKPEEHHTFEFKVSMKQISTDCKRGEIYVKESQTCVKCPPGTYSLSTRQNKCLPCPVGADCSKGGDSIMTREGFWRNKDEQEYFVTYPCPNKEKCTGGIHNKCAEGYDGPLCEACDIRDANGVIHRPFLRNTCKSCQNSSIWDIVFDIIIIAAPIGLLLYTVLTLVAPTSEVEGFSWCLYVNIFISYMQNLFVLGALDYIALPQIFTYIINIVSNPSLAVYGYLSCFFLDMVNSYEPLVLYMPFVLILIVKVIVVMVTVSLVASRSTSAKSTYIGLIWLCFLETPGFIDFTLRFFDCKTVGGLAYSPFFSEMECDSQTFENLRTYLLVPIVFCMTLACPLSITYALTRGSLRSDTVGGQKRLRVMILAKSQEHIVKSNRNWLFFYFASFARLGLLLMPSAETPVMFGFIVVTIYYGSLAVLNIPRKIVELTNWRANILAIDVLMVLLSLTLGYGLRHIEDGTLKTCLENSIWIANAIYVSVVYIFGSSGKEEKEYGQIKENKDSNEELPEGVGPYSEQLDYTS